MSTFTMEEFVKTHLLQVDLGDSAATKLIAEKLKGAGYKKIRKLHNGKRQMVWDNGRQAELEDLKDRLSKIKL